MQDPPSVLVGLVESFAEVFVVVVAAACAELQDFVLVVHLACHFDSGLLEEGRQGSFLVLAATAHHWLLQL
jgi:hypothetical protein